MLVSLRGSPSRDARKTSSLFLFLWHVRIFEDVFRLFWALTGRFLRIFFAHNILEYRLVITFYGGSVSGVACSCSGLAVVLLVYGRLLPLSEMFPGYFGLLWAVFCDFFFKFD